MKRLAVLLASLSVVACVNSDVSMPDGTVFRDCVDCPEMVVIPAGSFDMGSPSSEKGRWDTEEPVRQVTFREPLAVGKYEVTQAEWRSLMGTNPSFYKGNNRPVERVTWEAAKRFVKTLNQKTGKRYRLLSEAEWEYAARAGTSTVWSCGNSRDCLRSVAVYRPISTQHRSVGSKLPNAFGLYDMHGNVREWVEDCWHDDYSDAPTDGSAWTYGGDCSVRVLRGGSVFSFPGTLRSAFRFGNGTTRTFNEIGFRVARDLD